MYSFSKMPISAQAIRDIVTHHFGSQSAIGSYHELKDGYFNAAYMIGFEDGSKCVLKAAPSDSVHVLHYEKNIMRAEVEAMRLVRQRTQVPVPEIICYDTSRSIIPTDFFIMSFIAGVPFNKLRSSLPEDEQKTIGREVGRFARQMNEITATRFGYYAQDQSQRSSWREAFDLMLDWLLTDGQTMQVALPVPYDELRHWMRQGYAVLDEVTTPRLVHWDLWDGNIFVDPTTRSITGLIDFERALWADPLMEFGFSDLQKQTAFIEGYGQNLLDTPDKKLRRVLYNLYLYLIMIIECYYRKYETKDQENWARGQFRKEWARLVDCT